jgi:hypothetical protein
MLDEEQASQIVSDCIKAVSHVHSVDFNGTLDDAGIVDIPRVNNMITLIVNSKHIGVPSQQHRIDATLFDDVDSDTVVDEVVGIVRDNSTPVHPDPVEDFASLVAKHLAAHLDASTKKEKK